MATVAELEAAAAKFEAAGQTEKAAKLRAYAKTLPQEAPAQGTATQPTRADLEAAAEKFRAAGQAEKADKLTAYAATIAPVEAPATTPAQESAPREMPPVQPGDLLGNISLGGAPGDTSAIDAMVTPEGRLISFEAANPVLKGRYKVGDELPAPGTVVPYGGGGKGGPGQYTVQASKPGEDKFGDTAKAMMEGPLAAASAFGAGIMDSSVSPSREFIANDPATSWLPGFAQTGLSKIGDIGGAGLSLLGAGLGGAAGVTADVLPIGRKDKFAQDILDASMFAVPELSGFSSVASTGSRLANAAPKAEAATSPVPQAIQDAATAESLGIPVLRTDIAPPTTFIGKNVQKIGEMTPWGVGGLRAEQQEARIAAAREFATEFGADAIVPAIDGVAADLLATRAAALEKLSGQKNEVISRLDGAGVVPMTNAIAEIDKQIAALRSQKMGSLEPVIAKLEEFKTSLTDQSLSNIEANRKVIGEAFADPSLANIRSVGEKALSAVYGPLREDMAAFIKANGKPEDYNQWAYANEKLAGMASELKDSTLKRALDRGEATPEVVRTMLFSSKPSDVARLYKNLSAEGQAAARTAIMQEVLSKAGGLEALSPEKFKTQLDKLSSQIGVFFKGDDLTAAQGLARALKLTQRAGQANVAPLTGIQNLPAILGLGLGATFGAIKGAATVVGVGQLAKWYERSGTKSALKALANATTPAEEAAATSRLGETIKAIAPPAAANSTQQPDYMQLYGRY